MFSFVSAQLDEASKFSAASHHCGHGCMLLCENRASRVGLRRFATFARESGRFAREFAKRGRPRHIAAQDSHARPTQQLAQL
jgi:hypothetical protein